MRAFFAVALLAAAVLAAAEREYDYNSPEYLKTVPQFLPRHDVLPLRRPAPLAHGAPAVFDWRTQAQLVNVTNQGNCGTVQS